MNIGFLIPTHMEAENVPHEYDHVICAGYGAGKAAACSAAADLIFNKKCDTIIIWGLAGGLSSKAEVGTIIVGDKVAYRDYNIAPLMDSTGVGWVQDFAENLFVELDPYLRNKLIFNLKEIFPNHNVIQGNICSGDQFVNYTPDTELNRIELESDAVDMESAAVVHFCHNINKDIKVGIVRVISDNANIKADTDFNNFLKEFENMNSKLSLLYLKMEEFDLKEIESQIQTYPDFPVQGIQFKDIWKIFEDPRKLDSVLYLMKLTILLNNPDIEVTKITGIESRGFILGYKLAEFFNVPFVPIRKKGKLPGKTQSESCKTEYSEVELEIQEDSISSDDKVIVIDDIIATGGTFIAAKNLIEKCGGECVCCADIACIKGASSPQMEILLAEKKIKICHLFVLE